MCFLVNTQECRTADHHVNRLLIHLLQIMFGVPDKLTQHVSWNNENISTWDSISRVLEQSHSFDQRSTQFWRLYWGSVYIQEWRSKMRREHIQCVRCHCLGLFDFSHTGPLKLSTWTVPLLQGQKSIKGDLFYDSTDLYNYLSLSYFTTSWSQSFTNSRNDLHGVKGSKECLTVQSLKACKGVNIPELDCIIWCCSH